jgi:transposase
MLRLFLSTWDATIPSPLPMPPLLPARPPADPDEQRTLGRLAASGHAPADWILGAGIVVEAGTARGQPDRRRAGRSPKTVRQWRHRFTIHGVDGLGERPRSGRPRRLDQTERGQLVALVGQDRPAGWSARPTAPGRRRPQQPGVWTLDALVQAATSGDRRRAQSGPPAPAGGGARWRHRARGRQS